MNSEVFQKFTVLLDTLSLNFPAQLVRNHFSVSLPKKQQVDMVQSFGYFHEV